MRASRVAGIAIVGLIGGCIKGRDAPDLPTQALVPYGPKIFVADETHGLDGNVPASNVDRCNRRGITFENGTAEPTAIDPLDNGGPITLASAHNCYVKADVNKLKVDQIEVTNELYQLCVDSGACTEIPRGRTQKKDLCEDEELFDICPVLGASQV